MYFNTSDSTTLSLTRAARNEAGASGTKAPGRASSAGLFSATLPAACRRFSSASSVASALETRDTAVSLSGSSSVDVCQSAGRSAGCRRLVENRSAVWMFHELADCPAEPEVERASHHKRRTRKSGASKSRSREPSGTGKTTGIASPAVTRQRFSRLFALPGPARLAGPTE